VPHALGAEPHNQQAAPSPLFFFVHKRSEFPRRPAPVEKVAVGSICTRLSLCLLSFRECQLSEAR